MYDDVYYYKAHNNKEVGFFINIPDGPLLIQASYDFSNHNTQEREIKSIAAAMIELNIAEGYIYTYNTSDEIAINEKTIKVLPFWKAALEKTEITANKFE